MRLRILRQRLFSKRFIRKAKDWYRRLVFRLDSWLRKSNSVFEFSESPECVFRLQVVRLDSNVRHAGALHPKGDRIIVLHLWNEHVPAIQSDGPLAWAIKVHYLIETSFRELACWLAKRPDLGDVQLIAADAVFGVRAQKGRLGRMARRYGFDVMPAQYFSRPGALRRFGENVLISMFVLACNPVAFRLNGLWRYRLLMMMTRQTLFSRYSRAPDEAQARDADGEFETECETLIPLNEQVVVYLQDVRREPVAEAIGSGPTAAE